MRRRSERPINEINVSGFVSIMVALLFLFLADSAPHARRSRPPVDLAKVNRAVPVRGANREDAVIISLMRDGRVYLGNDQIPPDQLAQRLREAVNHSGDKGIYMNADARAKYGSVLRVVEVLQSEKIGSVVFLVDERKPLNKSTGQNGL